MACGRGLVSPLFYLLARLVDDVSTLAGGYSQKITRRAKDKQKDAISRKVMVWLIGIAMIMVPSVSFASSNEGIPLPQEWGEAYKNQMLEALSFLSFIGSIVSGQMAKQGLRLSPDIWCSIMERIPELTERRLLGSFDPLWIRWYIEPGQVHKDLWIAIQKYAIKMWLLSQQPGNDHLKAALELQKMYELPAGMPSWQRTQIEADLYSWALSVMPPKVQRELLSQLFSELPLP